MYERVRETTLKRKEEISKKRSPRQSSCFIKENGAARTKCEGIQYLVAPFDVERFPTKFPLYYSHQSCAPSIVFVVTSHPSPPPNESPAQGP